MKKRFLFLAITLLLFFHGPVRAKNSMEEEMKKKAKELSLTGQLDIAKELMGEDKGQTPKGPSAKTKAEDGWDMTSLMLSMIWGSIGTGYFIYGKKQARAFFLLCGIGLCVFPIFVTSNLVSGILGVLLVVAPFKIDF